LLLQLLLLLLLLEPLLLLLLLQLLLLLLPESLVFLLLLRIAWDGIGSRNLGKTDDHGLIRLLPAFSNCLLRQ